jgi:ketosteroid isomerase-like protein
MPSAAPTPDAPRAPADLYAAIEDAVNRADVDAFLAAHDAGATVVLPPDGKVARGRAEIRGAIVALLELRPRLTLTLLRSLQSDGLALAHGRWHLTVTDHGSRVELSGLGTMVAGRSPDGDWRVLLDDPLTGPSAAGRSDVRP